MLTPLVSTSVKFSSKAISVGENKGVKSIHSRVIEKLNKLIEDQDTITSEQFVRNLASSTDQGVAVMRDFYQKVLDLDSWNKSALVPLVIKMQENFVELDSNMNLLMDPKELISRVNDLSLNIDFHYEAIE